MKYLVIALFLGLAALVCFSEPTDEVDLQLAQYCEMVRIHKNSPDPALGWPDYKGIYREECR